MHLIIFQAFMLLGGLTGDNFELKLLNDSVLMTQKMKEMDDVIRRVHTASLQDNLDRTLLVCDSFLF